MDAVTTAVERRSMTRETAINLLDNLIGMVEDNQGNDYDGAFKMAIRSLKAWDKVRASLDMLDCIEVDFGGRHYTRVYPSWNVNKIIENRLKEVEDE